MFKQNSLPLATSISLLLGSALLCAMPSHAAPRGGVGHFESVLPAGTHFKPSNQVEALTATLNGKMLLYTSPDAAAPANGAIGFINISDPAAPTELPALVVGGTPTSVAVVNGRYAIAVVDKGFNTETQQYSGSAVVIDLRSQGGPSIAHTIALSGQPDFIAVSPNGRYAAVTIENERPAGVTTFPSAPAGALEIIDLKGKPEKWTTRIVDLTGLADDSRFPTDPEPEVVAINKKNEAAVTLQENNHIVIVDLKTGTVKTDFSAGQVNQKADLKNDGVVGFTDDLVTAREPDAIAWTPKGNLVTANEGDLTRTSGGRNITIFSPTGEVVFDPGSALEEAAHAQGLYLDAQSNRRGAEFNTVKVGRYGSQTYLFASSEKFNLVAVYRLGRDEANPEFVQFLRTGDEPEGMVAIPNRKLLVTANEDDDTLSIFVGKRGEPAPQQ